jgi:transposase
LPPRGASNLTFAEARWTQGLANWIGCHVNAFSFFGGVTRQVARGTLTMCGQFM